MLTGCFFVPFAALLFAVVKRSVVALTVVAVGINLGIWLYKYLTVVPAISPDHTPFDNWLDVSASLGLLAGFLALLLLLARRWPLFSEWEIDRAPEPQH